MTTEYLALIRHGSYINGQWHSSDSVFSVLDKATNAQISVVANAQPAQMCAAIDAANNALPIWSTHSGAQRSQLLSNWHTLITEHREALAQLLTREQGKPLAEARAEIDYGAGYIKWFAAEAERICGDVMEGVNANQSMQVVKKPVGVVGAITPWNFPNAMITRKAAAALAAGCTFVVKPAADTPLSALALAALAHQAGIPQGVLNVVVGTDAQSMGRELTQSPKVAKLSFTGSTKVGQLLIKDCAATVKRVSMELGGNAPFIVFDDADIEAALEGAMQAKFRNAGQTCVCANRFLVQAGIADAFVAALRDKVATLSQGNGIDNVDLGPLISQQAAANVHALVEDAVQKGARRHTDTTWNNSAFYPPVILSDISTDMHIMHQEIFGPVVALSTFDTEEQAICMANATEYGLAAYFYTRNYARMQRVANALQFGMLGMNQAVISNPAAPFGGVKHSGYGREGSKYGLDDYLSLQYRCIGTH
ncbi:NAD-dependent succinate-semialdehyde dehydrogenase [Aliiglaciecola litoralis]|uniref:NADP-dependent succinate-semialdehyde dehydrogenase n=1 Tax=Aliiglaciecola litoralis TaxID=582857 RepID=A0ABN1LPE0_9ALTE